MRAFGFDSRTQKRQTRGFDDNENFTDEDAPIVRATAFNLAACAALFFGCERKAPRLVVTEEIAPGVNTETAEYSHGSTRIVSRVAHYYNSPTGDHSEAGDFAAVFRAMTAKELTEPAAVRSVSALLAALEKEGVKLTAEPGGKSEDRPMEPRVRAFTVAH